MEKLRRILHCDLNSFYASVELLEHPELTDKPVAVCGNPDNRHGIILAKNEPAKKYRIQTAETVWQARRKCPDLILLPPHHKRYKEYSKIINQIYNRFTDRVEPFSIDESWLDVTGSMHLFGGSGSRMGELVRQTVKKETGLTISVGVSWNKIFAKMGSDYKKPDAVTVITPSNYKRILWPLPVRDLLFVGQKSARILNQMGIKTIGDLAGYDEQKLTDVFGKKGRMLYCYANGLDDAPVRSVKEAREIKSVGNGTTFAKDLCDFTEVRQKLYPLAESVSMRLKKVGLRCKAVQIVVKDSDFHAISRQKIMPVPTNLTKDIFETACQLVKDSWNFHKKIRMLTITGINLEKVTDPIVEQLSLLHEDHYTEHVKQAKVERTMEELKARFGENMVISGIRLKD